MRLRINSVEILRRKCQLQEPVTDVKVSTSGATEMNTESPHILRGAVGVCLP